MFETRRAEMQQRGTQAAHNAVLRLGNRERAWRKQYIHTVANEMVEEAVAHDCDVIGFEAVEQVEPAHTSQRCSRADCGFTHEDNRDGEQFQCLKCGYEINADYNGAKNVALRYMRKRQHSLRSSPTSGSADAPVAVRVHGGTLNGDGDRPPAES